MNQLDFANRRAVVTGGAAGIGLAVAERLAASGATVALWDRDAAALTGVIHSTNVDASGDPPTGHEVWSIVVHRIDGAGRGVQAHESDPRTPPAEGTLSLIQI